MILVAVSLMKKVKLLEMNETLEVKQVNEFEFEEVEQIKIIKDDKQIVLLLKDQKTVILQDYKIRRMVELKCNIHQQIRSKYGECCIDIGLNDCIVWGCQTGCLHVHTTQHSSDQQSLQLFCSPIQHVLISKSILQVVVAAQYLVILQPIVNKLFT